MNKLTAAGFVLALVGGLALGVDRPQAQTPPAQAVSGVRFHHVHLNSMNPAAAADYYPKAFTTATHTQFNGYEAVKTGNVYILFTKVNTPPPNSPQNAIWHFGWNTPDSREYLEKFHALKLDVVPMYSDPEGHTIEISSDEPGGLPTTEQLAKAKADGVQPSRRGGFQYLRGPDGALIENAGNSASEYFNHVHMHHEDPRCAQLWYTTHLGIGGGRGRGRGEPITAANCKQEYSEVTWPSLTKDGMHRNPPGSVSVSDMVSILVRPWHGPFVSSRGQAIDHFALSVPDLDATVARLKSEGVKVLEEIHPWGTMRAAMIEGPDLAAIELVEVKP
jgi:catechol 2,3-dioxygenase-like lactoylglutathione lyase family enzyme